MLLIIQFLVYNFAPFGKVVASCLYVKVSKNLVIPLLLLNVILFPVFTNLLRLGGCLPYWVKRVSVTQGTVATFLVVSGEFRTVGLVCCFYPLL